MTPRSGLALLFSLIAALCAGFGPAAAQTAPVPRIHAVLVGVSDYGADALGLGDLEGPRNDALLMADALIERGARPQDVRLLITDPHRAQRRPRHATPVFAAPDLAGIRRALDSVIETAAPGDQVVIHLAGHGWRQQETVRGSEISGLDEVFLPMGYAAGPEGLDRSRLPPLEGVLIDDEIGRYVDRLRGLGADVVFIGDFCHAGDATRGRPDFTAAPSRPRIETSAGLSAPDGRRVGAYVAFFAAPAGDRAMQGMAPIWAAGDQRAPHGLLSVYLAAALSDPAAVTWAEAAARVQASLIEHDVRDRAVRLDAPAQFEGQLDGPVLGQARPASQAWTVLKPALLAVDGRASLAELTLNAGALHGLTEDSLVALYETREGRERLMLYGRAVQVGPASTRLIPADGPQRLASAWADLRAPDGRPYTDERLWTARLEARGAPLTYRVAVPRTADDRHDLGALLAPMAEDLGVVLAAPGEDAHLYVHALPDGDVMMSESADPQDAAALMGRLDMSSYRRLPPRQGAAWRRQALGDAVLRAARAWRVRAILSALDDPGGVGGADGLRTELYLWRPQQGVRPGRCPPYHPGHRGLTDRPPADAVPFAALGLDAAQPPTLRPCDVIFSRIVNTGDRSLDVTPLSLSPDGTIWALPWMDGRPAVRFEPGRARMTAVQLDPAEPARIPREEMAVIAVRADMQGGAPAGFSRLAQPGVTSAEPMTGTELTRSDAGLSPLAALIEEARFGRTRSAAVPTAPDNVTVRRFSWRVDRDD